jgi:hypothetical protein
MSVPVAVVSVQATIGKRRSARWRAAANRSRSSSARRRGGVAEHHPAGRRLPGDIDLVVAVAAVGPGRVAVAAASLATAASSAGATPPVRPKFVAEPAISAHQPASVGRSARVLTARASSVLTAGTGFGVGVGVTNWVGSAPFAGTEVDQVAGALGVGDGVVIALAEEEVVAALAE